MNATELAWWVIPVCMWFSLVLVCAIVANMGEFGAEMAAASMFISGSLLCGSLAFACYLIAS